MAPKERKPSRKDDDSSSSSDTPKPPSRGRKPTLGNPGADPQRIHREYVEQHFGGGEEPTPEAYERALEEWHRLPGAVQRPPAEVRGPEESEALIERRAPASADDTADGAGEAGESTETDAGETATDADDDEREGGPS